MSESFTGLNIPFLRSRLCQKIEKHLLQEYRAIAFHSNSIVVCVNEAAATMFGYTEEEVIGMNAWLLFHPESAQTIMQHLTAKSEEPYQVRGIRKDKSEFKVELKGKDFEIDGEPVRSVLLKEIQSDNHSGK